MRILLPFLISIVSLLQSCEPVATFDKAQPAGQPSLRKIPFALRGFYITSDSAALLSVGPKTMILSYNKKLTDTTRVNIKEVVANGLAGSIIREDTLLSLSKDQVLKKYKGNYIVSTKNENGWEVMLISLQKRMLSFSYLNSKEALQNLPAVKASATDTTRSLYSPSRRQFTQLLKQGAFSTEDTFIRIQRDIK